MAGGPTAIAQPVSERPLVWARRQDQRNTSRQSDLTAVSVPAKVEVDGTRSRRQEPQALRGMAENDSDVLRGDVSKGKLRSPMARPGVVQTDDNHVSGEVRPGPRFR